MNLEDLEVELGCKLFSIYKGVHVIVPNSDERYTDIPGCDSFLVPVYEFLSYLDKELSYLRKTALEAHTFKIQGLKHHDCKDNSLILFVFIAQGLLAEPVLVS